MVIPLKALSVLLVASLFPIAAFAADNVPTERKPDELSRRQQRVTVKSLDLSRAPTTEDLIAAGQLGGALSPTHKLRDTQKAERANRDFGHAIERWNRHEYPQAVQLLRRHVKDYPDSPWAAEADLHVGCDATYNGRYSEAESLFRKVIVDHQPNQEFDAKMMVAKARQRLGLLKVEQNNLVEAGAIFGALLAESPDWRQRTYASHWLQRLSRFTAAKQKLLTCGADALAHALEKEGDSAAAAFVKTNIPSSMRGHSLGDLSRLAASQRFELVAVQIGISDLPKLTLPAILHIPSKSRDDMGHYWVLEKVRERELEIFDPQSDHRFIQTFDELAQEWNGLALVFSKAGRPTPGRKLEGLDLEALTGGCCGAPRREDDLGDPGRSGKGDPTQCSSKGAPAWSVNVMSMNLHVTDTPLWYDPPFGPPVRITLSYNSQSSIVQHEPFGNKWQFNYSSYLVVDTAGTVLVYMPDGRQDSYTPDSDGGYRKPYRVFNTLLKIAENHFELRFPDGMVYVYRIPVGTPSLQPFLTEIRDAYGNTLTLRYDTEVRLTNIIDVQGKVFTLIYDENDLVAQVSDPFGRTAIFRYDANRNLTNITDMGGYWSSFSYDTNIYLTSIANERGSTGFWIEPSAARGNSDNYPPPGAPDMWENYRITITDPLGQRQEFFYYAGCDPDGYGCSGYTWHVSPRDYIPWESQEINNYRSRAPKTRYIPTFTASGRRGEISRIVLPEGGYIQYGYDPTSGERTSVSDPHGHTWRYAFNAKGRVTSLIDPKGTPMTFGYSTNGVDLLSISNGLGPIRMAYSERHDILSLTDRLTNNTTFAHNTNGQIIAQADALGITNEYIYDVSGQLAELHRAGQTLGRFTYDNVGRVRTSTDATGLTLTNDYNSLNQVVRITYPDGRFESYAYSTCCPRLLESMTDRGGRTTVYIYDAMKRLIQTVNPEGGITGFAYDANGNRTSLTDPNGNVTSFAYDLDNRLIRKTYGDGKGHSFGYDQAGLLTTRTNARGITTSHTYDTDHSLLTTSYSDDTPAVTNTYDAFGRLTLVKDSVGTSVYTYDANSRPTSLDGPWTDDTITYGFDALGRRTNLTVQGSQPTAYSYDWLNRLINVRVGAETYAYTYLGISSLVQRLDRPNGSFTTYQYDGLNRLVALSNRRSTGEVINEFIYAYNTQDLRASETVSNVLTLISTNQRVTYDYNRLNQLVSTTPAIAVFAFDEDGNMTRGLTPMGYSFFAVYDARNRLKSFAFADGSSIVHSNQYLYDANSFLARVREYRAELLVADTRHIRSGYSSVQERNAINSVTQEYAWGLNMGGGIAGLLNLSRAGQHYSYVYDAGGNVVSVLDGSQAAVATYAYDAFGQLIAKAATVSQPFQFSTKPYDEHTGLTYFGLRFYCSALGRWMTRDPLGERAGLNLYNFAGNNAVNFVDPVGLECSAAQIDHALSIVSNAQRMQEEFRRIAVMSDEKSADEAFQKILNEATERTDASGKAERRGEPGGEWVEVATDPLVWEFHEKYHRDVQNWGKMWGGKHNAGSPQNAATLEFAAYGHQIIGINKWIREGCPKLPEVPCLNP